METPMRQKMALGIEVTDVPFFFSRGPFMLPPEDFFAEN
jgi:hypothetical protein